jgi:hypothetical protein
MQNKLSSQFTHGRSPSNPTKEKEGDELPAVGEMFTVDKAQKHDDSIFFFTTQLRKAAQCHSAINGTSFVWRFLVVRSLEVRQESRQI